MYDIADEDVPGYVGYAEYNTTACDRRMKGEERLVWNIRRIKEVRASRHTCAVYKIKRR